MHKLGIITPTGKELGSRDILYCGRWFVYFEVFGVEEKRAEMIYALFVTTIVFPNKIRLEFIFPCFHFSKSVSCSCGWTPC